MRFGLALLLLISPLMAQTPEGSTRAGDERQFALRIWRLALTTGHEISQCYLVLPNGQFRREYWEEQPTVGKSIINPAERYHTYAYEGQLSKVEMDSITTIIDRPEFEALKEPEQLKMSTEFMEVVLIRPRQKPHRFRLSAAADYKLNKAALDPLFAWIKQMDKRKDGKSRGEANKCSLPERIDFGSETMKVFREPLPSR